MKKTVMIQGRHNWSTQVTLHTEVTMHTEVTTVVTIMVIILLVMWRKHSMDREK